LRNPPIFRSNEHVVDGSDLKFGLELLMRVEEIVARAEQSGTIDASQLTQALSVARTSLLFILGAPAVPPAPSMDPMKTALRVLTAFAEKSVPEPADLEILVRVCGPRPAGIAWDEFACETLQEVLKDRAAARQTMAAGATIAR